ncbi:cytochrome P450 CYP4/CYP19/CYP26 subfamilies [Diaporthe helianthi]|uniref:Cytochrome P450 CYP4/CYP19/CYP26 subfamilies n=1 Tax=Diaporthe helianthi TaxID=158607 RepID=A0A2P5HFQ1_DIAHE|nr:cytochrome P450 CYP4/CYP19/CYP26 subfamilies [Diaporthe helianthi]
MAHISVVAALLVGVSYVVFQLLNKVVQSRQRTLKARQLGCKEPPLEKNGLPFGIDKILNAIKADKAELFLEWLGRRNAAMGAQTWRYSLLGQTNFFTSEPKNVQAILANNFGTFDLPPRREGIFLPLLGRGIFTQTGKDWKHSRELLRPQFTRDQVSDLGLEEQHLQNMIRALRDKIQPDGWTNTIEIQALFFRLTLDSATEFLLGESADSQLQHIHGYSKKRNSAADLHGIDFALHFDRAQVGVARRIQCGPLYWLYTTSEFRESTRQCNKFMDHYVKRALRTNMPDRTSEKEGKKKYVFLDALAEQTQDPVELRSQLMHMLLAGRDTTASLLAWLFHLLSKDPARYKKLRAIVIEEFGTFSSPKDITFARLKGCQYLQYCNNETLRLYPVVPVNSRWATEDGVLPTGGGPDGTDPVFVPKNSAVDYCIHLSQRRKEIWGPDADEFRPERWEGRKVGWEFVPFNGGPRICIGQQFALTEASYVTVRLLQMFDAIEDMEQDPMVRQHLTVTSCKSGGVNIRMHVAAQ